MSVFRKVSYRLALSLNRIGERELAFMRKSQWLKREQVEAIQQERLERLLAYAYQHVPYYKSLFERTGLVESGRVFPERLGSLPTLDKPTIRANFQALTSDQAGDLKAFENMTGGSTGEPLVFLQDRDGVRITIGAVLRLFYEWHGIEPGDREIKLWGSERDLFYRSHITLGSIREWMSGVKVLNAFRMTPERMREYIETINTYHPKVLRGYSSNLFELAQFAEENGLTVRPPQVVISSAGTFYSVLRQKMGSVYGCSVYNHYGSRELHSMAMECPNGQGLHISSFTHLIEVLDDQNQPCPPGMEGDLVVTSLFNFAMPFIRYKIGDRGAMSDKMCSCGRGLPLLTKLSGRKADCFWTREGKIVPGEYFVHLVGVLLKNNPVQKFQVIQESYDDLRFRLVLRPGKYLEVNVQREIEEKTRLVMGMSYRIAFEYVDDILPTSSGKYFYTVCKIADRLQPDGETY
ncbi:MAG: phenylacetate--CoA ligase family protein [Candidatus Roizmanbacteria bacterium]|nr:phenylacetate--CoA ligase family protein [Candidatus Roizmanbacteria bacterium]